MYTKLQLVPSMAQTTFGSAHIIIPALGGKDRRFQSLRLSAGIQQLKASLGYRSPVSKTQKQNKNQNAKLKKNKYKIKRNSRQMTITKMCGSPRPGGKKLDIKDLAEPQAFQRL